MTGIFDKNCYKLFGMVPPKQKITNGSTNKIIQKVKNIQTGLSNNCLESFGVKSQNRKQYITKKKKVGNKNENKNTFFDFLYLYKKYHLQNEIQLFLNNAGYSIKIQMIDNEKEIFIPIENQDIVLMFEYNGSTYFLEMFRNNNIRIRFIYEGNIIYINNTSLVVQINNIEDIHGIPKYPSEYIPIISRLKIPNKLLHSVINELFRQPNDHIPLYFNIINKKFFIRYWNTNLYIDNENFFILIQNKPLYFNQKIDYIKTPNEDKEYTVGNNILDIYYFYPSKRMENKIETVFNDSKLTIRNKNSLRSYNYNGYKKFVKLGLDSVFYLKKEDDIFYIRFNEQSSGEEILDSTVTIVRDRDITIGEFFQVTYPENLNVRAPIDIQNYNSIFKISEILLLLLPPDYTNIYFDVLEGLFFIDFYGMNLYFQKNTKNYIIFIENDIYIFNENLILQDIFQKDSYPVEDRPFTETRGSTGVTVDPSSITQLTRDRFNITNNPNVSPAPSSTSTNIGGYTTPIGRSGKKRNPQRGTPSTDLLRSPFLKAPNIYRSSDTHTEYI